jgi:hypothetical protein
MLRAPGDLTVDGVSSLSWTATLAAREGVGGGGGPLAVWVGGKVSAVYDIVY